MLILYSHRAQRRRENRNQKNYSQIHFYSQKPQERNKSADGRRENNLSAGQGRSVKKLVRAYTGQLSARLSMLYPLPGRGSKVFPATGIDRMHQRVGLYPEEREKDQRACAFFFLPLSRERQRAVLRRGIRAPITVNRVRGSCFRDSDMIFHALCVEQSDARCQAGIVGPCIRLPERNDARLAVCSGRRRALLQNLGFNLVLSKAGSCVGWIVALFVGGW